MEGKQTGQLDAVNILSMQTGKWPSRNEFGRVCIYFPFPHFQIMVKTNDLLPIPFCPGKKSCTLPLGYFAHNPAHDISTGYVHI